MTERTPQQSHQAYKLQIARLVYELLEQVRVHGTNETVDWGHVGDLAYVKDQLVDLATMLKGDEDA